jgi:hypothetical protein
MSDKANAVDASRQAHTCSGHPRAGAAEGVVCFECYRASHAREETLDRVETVRGWRPKLQPQRALTARAIQHRERMLEWIRDVAATSGRI